MKKKLLLAVALITVLALFVTGCGNAQKGEVNKEDGAKEKPLVRASHQPTLHGMPTWMAIEDGWVKDSPIDVEFILFPSGAPQNEALAAAKWDVGATGTVPTIMASLRYGAYMIAISNDESETNDIWVRPDSPLLKTKGFNKDFPDIYGSPDDWKGKKILTSTVSTGHYALSATLKVLGLKDSDTEIVHMEQSQALAAFEAGQGDILQLWAPFSYIGESKGWVKVSSGKRAGVVIPGGVVVRKDFADQNPELVVEWLDLYMKGVELGRNDPDKAAEWLYKYFNDYAGVELDKESVAKEFELRPLFNVEEQIELLEDPNKTQKWMSEVAQFFVDQGTISEDEKAKYLNGNYIEPKFMKMLAEKRAKQK